MLLHSCCTTLAKLLQKNNTLANSTFNFRQRPFWHTKRHIHRILHSRQGPLDRHSCVQAGFRMQNNSNLTTVRISSSILLSKEGSMQEQTTGQARTQDQSLLMLDHCQSSDLMRIVQFILLQQPMQNFYQQTCVQAGFRMQITTPT